jgi:site-specific recombinase XerC
MYQKVGIKLDIAGGVRQSVTHALRHLSTQILEDKSHNMEAAKVLLGHVNTENTEIYVSQTSAKVLSKKRKARKS